MRNKRIFGYILTGFTFLMVFFIIRFDNKSSVEIENNHKQIKGKEISGIVSQINQNRGTVRLDIKNPYQKYYFGTTRNYKLTPYDIDKFIQPGDSVFKGKNSMKLEVFKENKTYYFIIDEFVNKEIN